MSSVLEKELDHGWVKIVEDVVHPKIFLSPHSDEVRNDTHFDSNSHMYVSIYAEQFSYDI